MQATVVESGRSEPPLLTERTVPSASTTKRVRTLPSSLGLLTARTPRGRRPESDGRLQHVADQRQRVGLIVDREHVDPTEIDGGRFGTRRTSTSIRFGPGRRLFAEGIPHTKLELVQTKNTTKGVIIATYRGA